MVIRRTPKGIAFSGRVRAALRWCGAFPFFGFLGAVFYFYWAFYWASDKDALALEDTYWIFAVAMGLTLESIVQGLRFSPVQNPSSKLWLLAFSRLRFIAALWLGYMLVYAVFALWVLHSPPILALLACLGAAVGHMLITLTEQAAPPSRE